MNATSRTIEWKKGCCFFNFAVDEKLEIIVNGQVAWSGNALERRTRLFRGKLTLQTADGCAQIYGGETLNRRLWTIPVCILRQSGLKNSSQGSNPGAARR